MKNSTKRSKAKAGCATEEADNVITFPGCFVADHCQPEDGLVPYYCNDDHDASMGVRKGMVILTREYQGEELTGQLCLFRLQGELYMKRVRRTDEGFYISDDTAEKLFGGEKEEITILHVAVYACSCDMLKSLCTPVDLTIYAVDPWGELGDEWENFVDEIEDGAA